MCMCDLLIVKELCAFMLNFNFKKMYNTRVNVIVYNNKKCVFLVLVGHHYICCITANKKRSLSFISQVSIQFLHCFAFDKVNMHKKKFAKFAVSTLFPSNWPIIFQYNYVCNDDIPKQLLLLLLGNSLSENNGEVEQQLDLQDSM